MRIAEELCSEGNRDSLPWSVTVKLAPEERPGLARYILEERSRQTDFSGRARGGVLRGSRKTATVSGAW